MPVKTYEAGHPDRMHLIRVHKTGECRPVKKGEYYLGESGMALLAHADYDYAREILVPVEEVKD